MSYRSPSRGRDISRSPTPRSRYSPSPSPARRRRSPTRSLSPTPPRRNGRYRSESRSLSRDGGEDELRGSTKVGNQAIYCAPAEYELIRAPPLQIVVEKLTKTINEEHLREVFGQYGPIRDLDLPFNRQFNTNRGTAYILYVHEADAEAAIAHMHEAHLDGAVINVSIVLPRRKFSPSPPTASRGANIDPRQPAPGHRGGRGGAGAGGGRGSGFGGVRARSPPRHARALRDNNFDTYRPRSYSRSPPPPRRNRSADSYASRSRSPPRRRGGRKDSYDDYDNRRSRSRSVGRGYR
ncbi:Uu.00g119740.m01.CDS01 [Anthostomella pinea]|uniref:Uu.00g119740.m01.CDS01 n=1 Tax=Anthostomella pinea TaxID=933095 RepID=A0AAI8VGN9_9PEZI|nr:Uu.00g119740.m01.CDS01 [Anthostomella pinea]